MADTKISALTALDAFASGDLIPMVDDPSGTPVTKKATINQVRDYIIALANTWTATQTISVSGAVSAPGFTGTGTWYTGGSATTTKPYVLIEPTGTTSTGWSTSGTGIGVNAASGFTGNLIDLQLNGASVVAARYDGQLRIGSNYLFYTSSGTFGVYSSSQTVGGAGSPGNLRQIVATNFHAYGGTGTRGGMFGRLNSGASLELNSSGTVGWSSGSDAANSDTILTRKAAASFRLGAADAASPVAQTLGVQSVVAGTTNTAGADFTIAGSQGTGTGAGGSIIFQVAPAGSSGTAQNALATALTINSARNFVVSTGAIINQTNANDAALKFGADHLEVQYYAARVARIGSGGLTVRGDVGVVAWAPSSDTSVPSDLALRRDAANILAQRNGTNAQAFNIYNTYTDASNYERGFVKWDTNVLKIGTEKLGTGTARALEFQTDGTTRLTIETGGNCVFSGSMFVGSGSSFAWSGRARIQSPGSDGLTLLNSSSNGFGTLQFGGTTSSFPALKRSTTSLQVRLADDSDFAPLQGQLRTHNAYTAGAPTATGYIVLYDSTGTAYKVPAEAL